MIYIAIVFVLDYLLTATFSSFRCKQPNIVIDQRRGNFYSSKHELIGRVQTRLIKLVTRYSP